MNLWTCSAACRHPVAVIADSPYAVRMGFDVATEFDRQADNLIRLGYPQLAGLAPASFTRLLGAELRRSVLERAADLAEPTPARVPFVLVVTKDLVPAHRSMALTARGTKPGFADFDPDDLHRFEPIKEIEAPGGRIYAAFDLERGTGTVNLTPDQAMAGITADGRTPLTVAEGIALVTQFPATLQKNNCFSLAGSRCGDRRVPAIWISKNAPKLGWCWAGNPHTWLGTASCATRAGGPA